MDERGNILLIANPGAQLGHAREASLAVCDMLSSKFGEERIVLKFASGFEEARQIASDASPTFKTVIGIGGDGVLHFIAKGLMSIDVADRPTFGVIPVGNGNDYARSLGMSTDVKTAVGQILNYPSLMTDVGLCNGIHFLETLSFGIDAAIAIGTEDRRRATGHTGTRLYLEEGVDQMLHHLKCRHTSAEFDGGVRVVYSGREIVSESQQVSQWHGQTVLFAVQIGPTYGGGFLVAPQAKLADGVFDIALAKCPLTPLKATRIFLKAKNGGHTKFKELEFYRARKIKVSFECEDGVALPAQVDGEKIEGTDFDIKILPRALSVIRK
jgi:YegS/Rv2252/BmrU family lipid kinase